MTFKKRPLVEPWRGSNAVRPRDLKEWTIAELMRRGLDNDAEQVRQIPPGVSDIAARLESIAGKDVWHAVKVANQQRPEFASKKRPLVEPRRDYHAVRPRDLKEWLIDELMRRGEDNNAELVRQIPPGVSELVERLKSIAGKDAWHAVKVANQQRPDAASRKRPLVEPRRESHAVCPRDLKEWLIEELWARGEQEKAVDISLIPIYVSNIVEKERAVEHLRKIAGEDAWQAVKVANQQRQNASALRP